MSQLLVQADDIAISHATTLGILESIQRGIVRATGIFTNQPDAAFAAASLKALNGVDVGIDLNFVTGRPLLHPGEIPNLVRADGAFRTSHEIRAQYPIARADHVYAVFEEEPFDYEQTLAEARAQMERFLDLMGRPPAYVHHHSLVSEMSDRVLHEIADQYDLLPVDDILRHGPGTILPNAWYATPFGLQEQSRADPIGAFYEMLPTITASELSILVTHPGYVDAEILDLSSYSVIRARDLALTTSPAVRAMLAESGVELVSYSTASFQGEPFHQRALRQVRSQ